jgi:oxalate decarboxylase
VAQKVFDDIPLHNLWIFPGDEPGDLEADQVAAGVQWGGSTEPVIFRMGQLKPLYETAAAASGSRTARTSRCRRRSRPAW